MKKQIAIIGAGAAGYFAAIAASENPSNHCTLIEASNKPLAKLLISGGGRCNVTNVITEPKELIKNYPRGSKELIGAFSRFNSGDTVKWFESRGVKLHAESDGRMFPVTNQSRTIEKCLRDQATKNGVEFLFGKKIKSIIKSESNTENKIFELTFIDGEVIFASSIILATGSSPSGYKIAESLGHKIIDPVPSLFTFEIKDKRLEDLSGVSFEKVTARLISNDNKEYVQTGPMLITHWGLSGPAIIKLSAWGARELFVSNYKTKLIINFMSEISFEQCQSLLLEKKATSPKKSIKNETFLDIPRAYWERIISITNASENMIWADVSKVMIQKIAQELTSAEFKINGKGKFKEEFVTCGGVSLKEVDFRTMESKVCSGLFLAGEVLDIDGVTGGFNFQAAWTAGYIAGTNA